MKATLRTSEAIDIILLAEETADCTIIADMLGLERKAVYAQLSRKLKRGDIEKTDAPPSLQPDTPQPCPTCGHVPKPQVQGAPPRQFYKLTDERIDALNRVWTIDKIHEALDTDRTPQRRRTNGAAHD